jgi:hypothetical protein
MSTVAVAFLIATGWTTCVILSECCHLRVPIFIPRLNLSITQPLSVHLQFKRKNMAHSTPLLEHGSHSHVLPRLITHFFFRCFVTNEYKNVRIYVHYLPVSSRCRRFNRALQ